MKGEGSKELIYAVWVNSPSGRYDDHVPEYHRGVRVNNDVFDRAVMKISSTGKRVRDLITPYGNQSGGVFVFSGFNSILRLDLDSSKAGYATAYFIIIGGHSEREITDLAGNLGLEGFFEIESKGDSPTRIRTAVSGAKGPRP